jgi:DNA modification methylase
MNNGSHSWYSDRKQTSVWEFHKERFEGHTTPKPVALVEKAITNSSKGGDIVIDLFGGSGSTMIAAEKSGRCSRLMELDPKYCDVIVKRWEDFTGKKAILAEL